MRAVRIPVEALSRDPSALIGGVLLAPVRLARQTLAKGTAVDRPLAAALAEAAGNGALTGPLRIGYADAGDLHEDQAALRLAGAAAGPGTRVGAPRQSRVDLTARTDGVLRVNLTGLSALNRIDPLEVFTLFHGQAVRAGRVVAGVKVAPHLVPESVVAAGEAVARIAAPLIDVQPYLPLPVAAIAAEELPPAALARFAEAARTKVTALGGSFLGVSHVSEPDPAAATDALAAALAELAGRRQLPLVLVGGVSAGDPLAPFYEALARLGGTVLRRGVPAHPGSMIWLARLGRTTLLGLPQCGMFSLATAADLVLPRLLTGEVVTPETLADLGHGGLLGREMRFRFPDYAAELEAPDQPPGPDADVSRP